LFERFTTRAQRSVFFARYEASALGTMQVTAEELLLGILREDKFVAARVGLESLAAIREELEQLAPPKGERVPTSVDMAVSHETRRALEFATEEADALQHKMIDTPHLVLGLLRVEDCLAATLLRKHGLEYDSYRTSVHEAIEG
jgi:ATP-dependent Clp protease ATP-binding subunit ClpC